MSEIKLPIYTLDEKLRKEREEKYFNEIKENYPKIRPMTAEEYQHIRSQFEQGSVIILDELKEKSLFYVAKSVSRIYAKFDIEDILPLDDGFTVAMCSVTERINNFSTMPFYSSEYTNSTVSYLVYLGISREYNTILQKVKNVDFLGNAELINVIDSEKQEVLDTKQCQKDEFVKSYAKVSKILTENEKKVLALKFGFESGENMTFEKMAAVLNVTRGRVYEIFTNALRKLRCAKNIKNLEDYYFDMD